MTDTAASASSGVETLIERLRQEGVAKGRSEAERIIADAESRTRWMLRQAEQEAQEIREKARTEAENFKTAGREALQIAARDTVLDLKNRLLRRFTSDVERLIGAQLRDEAFLQRLILEVAARARRDGGIDAGENVEVLLPEDVIGVEELRRRPEELEEGSLSHFVLAVAGQILRQGVGFESTSTINAGIRVRLVERNVEIDLTERAVAALLLEHLQPRFRAFLEGIVR